MTSEIKNKPCQSCFAVCILIFCALSSSALLAQTGFKIKNLSFGYRISELDALGTNPFSVSPLLKNPIDYNKFISSFHYNGYSGNPTIQTVQSFYANAEIYKNRHYGFWKNAYLQMGLFATNQLVDDAGSLENRYMANTTEHYNIFTLIHNTGYAGINLGINRFIKLRKKLLFSFGFQIQGSLAFSHFYQPQLDSLERKGSNEVWDTIYHKELPELKGKNYFQWQIMLPFEIEYQCGKRISLRAELAPGYIRSKYRNRSFTKAEAYSAGLWIIYSL